jgi:hypothetical protein
MEGSLFHEQASRWMHGVDEDDLLDHVVKFGLEKVVVIGDLEAMPENAMIVSRDKLLLAKALSTGNMEVLKRCQIERIIDWFQHAGEPSRSEHAQCFQSLLNALMDPWDLQGFEYLIQAVRDYEVHWDSFEREILQIRKSVSSWEDPNFVHVVELIGDSLGHQAIVTIFASIGESCLCIECPEVTHLFTALWARTQTLWMVKWRDSLHLLQRVAILASSSALFQILRNAQLLRLGEEQGEQNPVLLHFVRNPFICKELLPFRRVEETFGDDARTALAFDAEWPLGGPVARVLLREGNANALEVLKAARITPQVFLEVMVMHPSVGCELCAVPHWKRLINHATMQVKSGALLIARALKGQNVRIAKDVQCELIHLALNEVSIPSTSVHELPYTRFVCALFCFGVNADVSWTKYRILERVVSDEQKEEFFFWKKHTHLYCSKRMKCIALSTMLILKSVNMEIPPEIANMILNWGKHRRLATKMDCVFQVFD